MSFPIVVDCSRWQPVDLDWPALKAAGVGAVLVQLTHGTQPEPHAMEHYGGATRAGLLVGFYHFLVPWSDPVAQAAAFYSRLPAEWRVQPGRMALDCEDDALGSEWIREWLRTFYAYYPSYRAAVMIYTGKGWWESHISHDELDWRYYELWAAGGPYYKQAIAAPPDWQAPLPWPWDSAVMWQFTGKGKLPGYDGDLDLSITRMDGDEFVKWWTQDTGPQPVPGGNGDELMPITRAQQAQYLIDLDAANARISQTRASIAALVPDEPPAPPPWWESLPSGVFPAPRNYAAQPAGYKLYDAQGNALALNPRTNAGQMFERNGELIRVTISPPIAGLGQWWIKASELKVIPV